MTLPTPHEATLALIRSGKPFTPASNPVPIAVPTTEGPLFTIPSAAQRMVDDARAAVAIAIERAGL
jgi:hypothetical protein